MNDTRGPEASIDMIFPICKFYVHHVHVSSLSFQALPIYLYVHTYSEITARRSSLPHKVRPRGFFHSFRLQPNRDSNVSLHIQNPIVLFIELSINCCYWTRYLPIAAFSAFRHRQLGMDAVPDVLGVGREQDDPISWPKSWFGCSPTRRQSF